MAGKPTVIQGYIKQQIINSAGATDPRASSGRQTSVGGRGGGRGKHTYVGTYLGTYVGTYVGRKREKGKKREKIIK